MPNRSSWRSMSVRAREAYTRTWWRDGKGLVTAALFAHLCNVLRRQHLARVLLRRADIDDLRSVAGDLLEHVVAQSADRCIGTLSAVFGSLERRALGDEGPTLGDPLRATAVH